MNSNVIFSTGYNFGSNIKVFCTKGHFLDVVGGRNAMCDVCRRCGLNTSYACIPCNFDMCEGCAMNQNFQTKLDNNYSVGNYKQRQVPAAQVIKIFDRNHQTHMFVGNGKDSSGDHTVYSCKQSGFNPQNFEPRTAFVIVPTRDGYFQIMDTDHKAFLFVGNGQDNGGDHTVYASPQSVWKSYEDFLQRTSFSFVQVNDSWRVVDKNKGACLFVGNGDDGGDHTVYAVPMNKLNMNQKEWNGRTAWDIQGAKPQVPLNRVIKAYDINHSTFMFVGNSKDEGGDHTVFACKQTGFDAKNFHPRTNLVILPTNNGTFQIMDVDHQAFLFVGNGKDEGGDHTVYACPQKTWKSYDDFMKRTAFQLVPVQDNLWRLLDCNHNTYLFIGNGNDGGDHTVYSVPVNKFNQNQNEWAQRTLFYLN